MSPEKARAEDASASLKDAKMISDSYGNFLVGRIYHDSLGQYQDGDKFTTSYVRKVDPDFDVFDSRTGVIYTVENWAQDGQ